MVASVAVLSDIHGVLPALDAVLAEPAVQAAEGVHNSARMPRLIVDRYLRNPGVTVHDPGCRPAGYLSCHASPGRTGRGGPRGSSGAEIPLIRGTAAPNHGCRDSCGTWCGHPPRNDAGYFPTRPWSDMNAATMQ